MSDARFTKYGQRTKWHAPAPKLDSPRFYGWDKVGIDPDTEYDVFQLGNAYTRAATPQERFEKDCDCVVILNGDTIYYSGAWEWVTADVREMQGLPELQKREPYFMPEYKIPAAAFKNNA